jgi:tetratricopeptide (TPR) repeat protein
LKSLEQGPSWYIPQINLALCLQGLGRTAEARRYLDRAVALDLYSGLAPRYRGEARLAEDDFPGALADFLQASQKSLEHLALARGLATAHAGLADAEACYAQIRRSLDLDPDETMRTLVPILRPFFLDPPRALAGLDVLQRLQADLPGQWWVYENQARLLEILERPQEALAARSRSRELQAGSKADKKR